MWDAKSFYGAPAGIPGLLFFLALGLIGCGSTEEGNTLTVQVDPSSVTIPAGTTQVFHATGSFADGTSGDITSRDIASEVNWTADDAGIAEVVVDAFDNAIATGLSPGSTIIRATDPGTGLFYGAAITVVPAALQNLFVVPSSATIVAGTTAVFHATGLYNDGSSSDITDQVNWPSSDEAVATVVVDSFANAIATGVAPGQTNIFATDPGTGLFYGAAITVVPVALQNLFVVPSSATIVAGTTAVFHATGQFNDGSSSDITDQVIWTSNDEAVATVAVDQFSNAIATGVAPGQTNIFATDPGTGLFYGAALTVQASVLQNIFVNPTSASVATGGTKVFHATGQFSDGSSKDITDQLTWTSSDEAAATVVVDSFANAIATGVSAGSVTLTATDPGTGMFSMAFLTVTP